MVTESLEKLSQGVHLTESEARDIMNAVMNGEWTDAQIAGLLMALKSKGETVDEISGFVKAMREKAIKIDGPENAIDTCGTGGDGSLTFNISTTAGLVAAAAGVPVAKHGNRAVSSRCGSADVLKELGVNMELTPEQTQRCLHEVNIAFLFAPVYHASMKYAAGPRREMGLRTVFNILGPMCNPAGVKRQLVGAFDVATAKKMTQVLRQTGSEHVLVVHSEDGLDEISISSPTHFSEFKKDEIQLYQVKPEDFGLKSSSSSLTGADPSVNASLIREIFAGADSTHMDITLLNAGAAIYIGGKAESITKGVEIARESIKSGAALKKLNDLVEFTQACS